MGMFDLEKNFAFYGAYHSNPVNVFIHKCFVWPNFFTMLILFYYTPPIIKDSPPINLNFCQTELVFNYGFLLTSIYCFSYVAMDKKVGSLAALLCFLCWLSSTVLAHTLGFSLAWKVSIAVQLVCWTAQIIGHGMFEKRSPAFLDNFAQAFIMAPYFVLLEALQSLFGYEPYPGFHASVQKKTKAEIKKWQERNQKKIS